MLTTTPSTLSLHDALPISLSCSSMEPNVRRQRMERFGKIFIASLISFLLGIGVSSIGLTPVTNLHAQGGSLSDRKSTRLNSSHQIISYAVFCLKKKKNNNT